MEVYLKKYLKSEKQTAWTLLIIGTIATVFGLVSVFQYPKLLWLGLGLPFLLLGLLELATGIVRYMTSSRQHQAFGALIRDFPQQFIRTEQHRLSELIKHLDRKRNTELLLLVLGIGMTIVGGISGLSDLSMGIGIGLSIQAAILLIDSLITQWRAGLFQHEVRRFSPGNE